MIPDRHDQTTRSEAAFNICCGIDFQRAARGNFPDESSLDNRLPNQRICVKYITLLLEHQPPISAEIYKNRLYDLIIAQIHMAAAPLAHRRFRGQRYFKFRVALETAD